VIRFDVTREATLAAARVTGATRVDPALEGCLLASLDGARFTGAAAPSRVTYPLYFEPGPSATAAHRAARAAPARKLHASCCSSR
jgi:hypothetical protein